MWPQRIFMGLIGVYLIAAASAQTTPQKTHDEADYQACMSLNQQHEGAWEGAYAEMLRAQAQIGPLQQKVAMLEKQVEADKHALQTPGTPAAPANATVPPPQEPHK